VQIGARAFEIIELLVQSANVLVTKSDIATENGTIDPPARPGRAGGKRVV
jgi:hypothetical protein